MFSREQLRGTHKIAIMQCPLKLRAHPCVENLYEETVWVEDAGHVNSQRAISLEISRDLFLFSGRRNLDPAGGR